MNEVKVTSKMTAAIAAVKALGGKATAKEVLSYLNVNEADRVELKTVNSVNATLAYAAKAEVIGKTTVPVDGKMYTQYLVPTEDAE